MMKFTHISNYSDLMGFTIFKCGSGYQEKIPNSCKPTVWDFCFALRVRILSPFSPHGLRCDGLLPFPYLGRRVLLSYGYFSSPGNTSSDIEKKRPAKGRSSYFHPLGGG